MRMPTWDYDPDALRERHRAERDRRVRADGNEQYVEVTAMRWDDSAEEWLVETNRGTA